MGTTTSARRFAVATGLCALVLLAGLVAAPPAAAAGESLGVSLYSSTEGQIQFDVCLTEGDALPARLTGSYTVSGGSIARTVDWSDSESSSILIDTEDCPTSFITLAAADLEAGTTYTFTVNVNLAPKMYDEDTDAYIDDPDRSMVSLSTSLSATTLVAAPEGSGATGDEEGDSGAGTPGGGSTGGGSTAGGSTGGGSTGGGSTGGGSTGGGTPGAGTPGAGTPGAGTPGAGTPGAGTPGGGTIAPVVIANPDTFRPAQLAALSPAQVATITPSAFGQLPPATMGALGAAQAAQITPEQASTIRPSRAAELTPSAVAALDPEAISALRPAAVKSLTTAAVKAMTPTQLRALTPRQVSALTTKQWAALSPAQKRLLG